MATIHKNLVIDKPFMYLTNFPNDNIPRILCLFIIPCTCSCKTSRRHIGSHCHQPFYDGMLTNYVAISLSPFCQEASPWNPVQTFSKQRTMSSFVSAPAGKTSCVCMHVLFIIQDGTVYTSTLSLNVHIFSQILQKNFCPQQQP